MTRFIISVRSILAIALFTMLVPAAFARGAQEAGSGERISLEGARELVESGEALFLDVRDENSYITGHIAGAYFVAYADIAEKAAELGADGRTIITYCACPAEETSLAAASSLIAAGVTDVYVLEGGIQGWSAAGLPINRGSRP